MVVFQLITLSYRCKFGKLMQHHIRGCLFRFCFASHQLRASKLIGGKIQGKRTKNMRESVWKGEMERERERETEREREFERDRGKERWIEGEKERKRVRERLRVKYVCWMTHAQSSSVLLYDVQGHVRCSAEIVHFRDWK